VTAQRRLASVLIGALILMSYTSFAVAGPSAVAAWTQDGYGPGNTGYNPDAGPLAVDKLRQRWSVTPATGVEGCTTTPGPPLVAAGRVFFFDSGGVGAYDAETGRNLWRSTGFSLLGPTLAVADGLVLITDTSCYSQSNYETTITALDARTGKLRWTARESGAVDLFVADRGVIVTHGYCAVCGDFTHEVVAFRTSDGKRLWNRRDALLAGPVSAAGRVILSVANHALAVDVCTGATLWTSKNAWWAASATPAGDRFYAADDNDLAAVDAGTGKVAWRVEGGAGAIAADGRRVFVAATGVTAYDARTGHPLWSRAVPDAGRPIRASGMLWVTAGGRPMAILAPTTGKTVAAGQAFSTAAGHVVVAAHHLFTTDGTTIRAYAP
jgi:outer membrane protein assembly factor BamB